MDLGSAVTRNAESNIHRKLLRPVVQVEYAELICAVDAGPYLLISLAQLKGGLV